MSLILEALKKAERQHRLGEVPGIGSAPVTEAPGRNRWLVFLLLSGIAIAMLILGVYLGSAVPEAEETAVNQEVPSPPPLPEPIQPQPAPQEQLKKPAQPRSIVTVDVSRPEAAPQSAQEPAVELAEEERPVVSSPARPPEPPPSPKQLSELPDGFVSNLPKLNIDIHSFDERPGRSYVLINLEKYREGEYLAEGPLLSKILWDGVVLEHMGERFILPIGNY